jgi:hypothetical protein
MPQLLPLIPSEPSYRISTVLDGTTYVIDARWNGRDDAWYLDLYTDGDVLVRAGMKVVLGALIGRRSASALFPSGFFIAIDASGEGREAGFDDLGARVGVYYYTVEEAAAL